MYLIRDIAFCYQKYNFVVPKVNNICFVTRNTKVSAIKILSHIRYISLDSKQLYYDTFFVSIENVSAQFSKSSQIWMKLGIQGYKTAHIFGLLSPSRIE